MRSALPSCSSPWGRLGDEFGRRLFATAMVLFVVTSVACTLAPDPVVLVVARVAQGAVHGAAARQLDPGGCHRVLVFGALHHGYGPEFERSVLQMGALLLVVAALTRLMPGRPRTS
jgi:MFS family permease